MIRFSRPEDIEQQQDDPIYAITLNDGFAKAVLVDKDGDYEIDALPNTIRIGGIIGAHFVGPVQFQAGRAERIAQIDNGFIVSCKMGDIQQNLYIMFPQDKLSSVEIHRKPIQAHSAISSQLVHLIGVLINKGDSRKK